MLLKLLVPELFSRIINLHSLQSDVFKQNEKTGEVYSKMENWGKYQYFQNYVLEILIGSIQH
jgi:hypothetical protein